MTGLEFLITPLVGAPVHPPQPIVVIQQPDLRAVQVQATVVGQECTAFLRDSSRLQEGPEPKHEAGLRLGPLTCRIERHRGVREGFLRQGARSPEPLGEVRTTDDDQMRGTLGVVCSQDFDARVIDEVEQALARVGEQDTPGTWRGVTPDRRIGWGDRHGRRLYLRA